MLKKVRFKVGKLLSSACSTFPSKKSLNLENVLKLESVKLYISFSDLCSEVWGKIPENLRDPFSYLADVLPKLHYLLIA